MPRTEIEGLVVRGDGALELSARMAGMAIPSPCFGVAGSNRDRGAQRLQACLQPVEADKYSAQQRCGQIRPHSRNRAQRFGSAREVARV